jgi:hypothetical protein
MSYPIFVWDTSNLYSKTNLNKTKGLFIWRRVTRQGELLAQAGQTSALLKRVTRHLLHDCRMNATWRRKRQNTKRKSFETLKNITKYSESTRISAEKFGKTYLSIRMYFWAIIFQMQSTYILSRATELPVQSVWKYVSRLGEIPPLSAE